MAVLTSDQFTELRQKLQASVAPTTTATKPQINAATQAIENYFETTVKPGINTAIEAVAPGVFTVAQKKQIVKYYVLQKAGRE